ncbi:MAG: biotin/lipoyl-binding protein [Chloroflexota bacterium]|nr:MAG: biotin/lipoyl-binding protein [Chloroflexota bacterium]
MTVYVGNRPLKVDVQGKVEGAPSTVLVDGKVYGVSVEGVLRASGGKAEPVAKQKKVGGAAGDSVVRALMPGKVVAVKVCQGDLVEAGALLLVLEAMKMENEIHAPKAGKIKTLSVVPGSNVSSGDVLVVLE